MTCFEHNSTLWKLHAVEEWFAQPTRDTAHDPRLCVIHTWQRVGSQVIFRCKIASFNTNDDGIDWLLSGEQLARNSAWLQRLLKKSLKKRPKRKRRHTPW
jgi:hypothetical protein